MLCRPVDCNNGSLLSYNPGFVNSTIYSDQMEAGWGYHPWISGQPKVQASSLNTQGAGINNSTAICATLPPGASHCTTLLIGAKLFESTLCATAVHFVSSVKQVCKCKSAVSILHYMTPTVSPIVMLHYAACVTYVGPHAVNIAYLKEDLCIEGGDMPAKQHTFSFAAQSCQMTCASMSYTIN